MSKVKKLHTRREKLQNLNKNDVLDFMMNNAIFLVLLGLLMIIIAISPDFVSVS